MVIGLGMLIRSSNILNTPAGAIGVITVAFVFEIFTFIVIFYLFVREIENKEYDNLKIIGEIENYLKKNQGKKTKLKFDEMNKTEVYDRLKNFMNIEYHEELHHNII